MAIVLLWNACSKDSPVGNNSDLGPDPDPYPEAPNTIIALYNLRSLYTGEDVTLTKENMSGTHQLAVVVTSDHSAGNLPDGWLVAQDRRHQNMLRGITIPLEAGEAAKYVPGDSLVIDVEGGILTRINNHLQLTNIQPENIVKIASRRHISENRLSIEAIAADPNTYESTFITTETALGFTPAAVRGDNLSGNKALVSGTAQLTLSTRMDSPLADLAAPLTARFSGIISNTTNGPVLYLRAETDMAVVTDFPPLNPHPDAAAFVISGWMANPSGNDTEEINGERLSHEYIQFLALRDIDFSQENFAVITCNNAGQTNGTPPAEGWVTGGSRTYKFNLTSGSVAKGQYFYLNGNSRKVNGSTSINTIPEEKSIVTHDYFSQSGYDGVGNATGGLLANSGLTFGVAAFKGTDVNHDTEPMDVVFLRNPDKTYTLFGQVNGADRGFRVTNTDYYVVTDVIKFINQYNSVDDANYINVSSVGGAGSSVSNTGDNNFLEFRGEYDIYTATWKEARSRNLISLSTTSTITDIETANSTKMTPAP
ncbi:hypothetical protein G5B30_06590 [Sphingobacterium sp. SGG-5]|uniref:DUF5689 domain-containing protein n=1 Tax=Sphingobacterium sp. SGG-5 TaxID=2710881 RepID=UPI0013EBAC6E|nr:DUF5689 domain-containing protein [Sphingobacterium sp. SGG-5]NGM61582.1 hypothetical protein [Sphingobacterium sp. SGG-5]